MQERFSKQDVSQFAALGKSSGQVRLELETLRTGIPSIQLNRPCRLDDGVRGFPDDSESLLSLFEDATASGRVMKFVPASGAASRMFQLLSNLQTHSDWSVEEIERKASCGDAEHLDLARFLSSLSLLPFHGWLEALMSPATGGRGRLRSSRELQEVCDSLLGPAGLDFANLPKGLIPFHAYPDGPRTALEEHLLEAVHYVRDRNGRVRVHFTIPEQYHDRVGRELTDAIRRYEQPGTSFEVSLSVQDPSTDTVACDSEYRPFRTEDGRILFRPAGHGTLLANLSSLQADIVFLRNIDNIPHERFQRSHCRFRRILGGYLVRLQKEVFSALETLAVGQGTLEQLDRIHDLVSSQLSVQLENSGSKRDRMSTLFHYLNRPLRVCGVVRNEGDSGGGPFWVEDADGEIRLQIVESSQVDTACPEQRQIWESSAFFNPVEIVCGLRSFEGRPFELSRYCDPSTGLVAEKSWDGRQIKVLELPGLWNGSMAYWNTVFVEIPRHLFTPVKTVLDLLEPAHQPAE